MFYPARFPKPCRILSIIPARSKKTLQETKNPAKFNFCGVFILHCGHGMQFCAIGEAYMRRQTNTINYGTALPLAQGIKFDF
jgi:hypothetical protein